MGVEALMQALGARGVTVIIKIDHERASEGSDPWTLVLSGPGVGRGEFIRVEAMTLASCINQGVRRLCEKPGDWEWLSSLTP